MFKKNEESEWTRFSRALGGKDQPGNDAAPSEEAVAEEQTAPAPVASGAGTAPGPAPEPTPAPFDDDGARPFESPEVTPMGGQAVDPQPYDDAWASEPPAAAATAPAPTSSWDSRSYQDDGGAESLVGDGTTIEGTLRSEHSIRIRGAVQGEVESKRMVFVEDAARVNAKVTAEGIAVSGEVNGELHCPGRVEIAPSGRVTGEISAGSLIMQEGAYFEGHLKMLNREAGRDAGVAQPGQ